MTINMWKCIRIKNVLTHFDSYTSTILRYTATIDSKMLKFNCIF